MNKKIVIVLFLSLLASTTAFAQVKIGYANPERIFASMPEVRTAGETLSNLISSREQELDSLETALTTELQAYNQIRSSLSIAEQQAKEQEITEKDENLGLKSRSYQEEIQRRQVEIFGPIEEKVNSTIAAVAEELGLDLILSEGTRDGGSYIFFAGNSSVNITEQVIQKLNQ